MTIIAKTNRKTSTGMRHSMRLVAMSLDSVEGPNVSASVSLGSAPMLVTFPVRGSIVMRFACVERPKLVLMP